MGCAAHRFCSLCAALILLPLAATAAPRLRCNIVQGGSSYALEFKPGNNPYDVAAVDIGRSFRFKAVVIGDEQKIDYLKLYVYYQSPRQPVLLHSTRFLAPTALPAPVSLTGLNYVYSPRMERELQYDCSVFEVAAQ